MDNLIVLRFGPSPSKYFRKAVGIAQNFSRVTLTNEPKTCRIEMYPDEFLKKEKYFWELQKIIKRWESSEFYLANRKIIPFKSLASSLKQVLACAKGFTHTDSYCQFTEHLEGWSCIHLQKVKLHLMQELDIYNGEEYWYKFGKFKDINTWAIDKQKIENIVGNEIREKYLQLCPFFSLVKVREKIENLPEAIDLYSNPHWEVESIRDFENGEIVEKPIGIIPLEEEVDDEQKKGLLNKLGLLSKAEKEIENEKRPKRFIPDVKFEDIGGIDEIITKIREVIELPIMQPELFRHLGIQPHKGIILYGPPGTGKTMIAKAIANEIKAHFILVNGPEILSKWVGESEKNLRDLFEEANKYQPSVIFFDEIDAIASKRSGSETGRNAAQIVNQLLTLFDGVKENKGVVILASTNRIELLDSAILRSGRFDYKIAVPNPNLEGCRIILEIKTRNMPVGNSLNINEFSAKLLGLSGAEIAFVVNEAAYNALRRTTNIKQLVKEDIEQNFDTIKIEKKDFEKALKTLLTEKKTKNPLGFNFNNSI